MRNYSSKEQSMLQNFIDQLEPGFDGHYQLTYTNQRSDVIMFDEFSLFYKGKQVVLIKLRYHGDFLYRDVVRQMGLGPRQISYELKLIDENSVERKLICYWPLPALRRLMNPELEVAVFHSLIIAAQFYLSLNQEHTIMNLSKFLTDYISNDLSNEFMQWHLKLQSHQQSLALQMYSMALEFKSILTNAECIQAFSMLVNQIPLTKVPEMLRFRSNYSSQSHVLLSHRPQAKWSKMTEELIDAAYVSDKPRQYCNELTFDCVWQCLKNQIADLDEPLLLVSVGCITGDAEKHFLKKLTELGQDVRIAGFDINENFIKKAQERFRQEPRCFFDTADVFKKTDFIEQAVQYFFQQDSVKRRIVFLAITGVLSDGASTNTSQALQFMQYIYSQYDCAILTGYTALHINNATAKRLGHAVTIQTIEWTNALAGNEDKLPSILMLNRYQSPLLNKPYIDRISEKRSKNKKTLDLSFHAAPIPYLIWLQENYPNEWCNYKVVDLAWSYIKDSDANKLCSLLNTMPLLELVLVESLPVGQRLLSHDLSIVEKGRVRNDQHFKATEVPCFSRLFLARVKNAPYYPERLIKSAESVAPSAVAAELLSVRSFK